MTEVVDGTRDARNSLGTTAPKGADVTDVFRTHDVRWERLAALAGVVGVVLIVIQLALQGEPPTAEDPAEEMVAFLVDKEGALLTSSYLHGLAIAAFAWFFGALWRGLRSIEGDRPRLTVTALVGAILGGALVTASVAIAGGLALQGDAQASPDVTRALYLIGLVFLGLASFGFAALTAATGLLVLRSRTYPAWLGILSLVSALLWLLGGVIVSTTAEAWSMVGLVALLVWMVWVLATSVVLYQRTGDVPVPASRTA